MVSRRSVRWPLETIRLSSGFIGIRAVIPLRVRTQQRHFETLRFQVDSGTSITTMSITEARNSGIAVPTKSVLVNVRTATGKVRKRVHPGHITVRIPGLEGREFYWPCHFVDYKDSSQCALLGPAGVINDLRITLEGTYALEAPHGWVIMEELTARGK
jgi:hypothetical protein